MTTTAARRLLCRQTQRASRIFMGTQQQSTRIQSCPLIQATEAQRLPERLQYSHLQTRQVFSLFPAGTRNLQNDDRNNNADSISKNITTVSENAIISMPNRQQSSRDSKQLHPQQHLPRQEASLLELEIQELMESPVGSFGPSAWLQVQKYSQYLCGREDMYRVFQLLDRAVKEPDARIQLTNDIIYPVIQQWLALYVRQQKAKKSQQPTSKGRGKNHGQRSSPSNSNIEQRLILSPLTVWKKIELYQQCGVRLESATYQKIIEGTAHINSRKPKNPNGPLLAETILENMMSQSQRDNPLVRPSASVYNAVLLSWDRAAAFSYEVATEEAPGRALALLNRLRTLYDSGWGPDFLPDKLCFYRVMSIFSHNGDGDQVEALLEDLYAMYLDHDENLYDLRPTTPFFSLVLYAWSKSRDPKAAERAEVILDRMLDLEASGEIRDLEVNAKCFNIVMICWSKLRTIEAARKAQEVFDRMSELSKSDANKAPTGGSYVSMITTWSRFDPLKVEHTFERWTEEQENGNCDMRKDEQLLNTLVSAWHRSNHPERAERADKLLQDAIQDTLVNWKPTTDTFNMVISSWCQTKTAEGIQRAEALLIQMEQLDGNHPRSTTAPNLATYLPIIRGWVDLGQIERAEELLTDCFLQISGDEIVRVGVSWEECDDEGQADDSDSPNITSKHKKRGKPTKFSKSRLLNIVLKTGWLSQAAVNPDAASRAEELLLSTHNFNVKPNAASFQYVLDAWRKNHKHFKGRRHMAQPKVDEMLALMDRHSSLLRLGGNDNLYLTLRRNWKLLSVRR